MQKEISLEYLTEEKFYPLGTTDEYFEAPYEEYPITICGQTVILTNGELAAALLSLPEKKREIIFFYFFGHYTQQEIGEMYGSCRSTTGYQIRRTLQLMPWTRFCGGSRGIADGKTGKDGVEMVFLKVGSPFCNQRGYGCP